MAAPPPAKGPAQAPPPAALDPNTPLTPQNIQQIATYLANQQTQAPISDLTKSIATNTAQTQAATNLTGGYFNTLGQQAGQGVMAQNNISNGLNNQLSQIGAGTQSQLQGIGQNAMSSLLKYAPQSDPQHSLAAPALGSMATEIARQQGLAAQNSATSRAFGATQGANFQNLAASNLGTFALRGQEALKGIQQAGQLRNQPLAQKIADLQASKGGLIATNIGKLRQQEITNTIARAGLGIKAQSVQATVNNNNARNALTARGQNITLNGQQLAQMRSDRTFQLDQQKFGAAQAKDSYLRSRGLGPYKVPTAAQLPKVTPTGTPTLAPAAQQQRFAQVDTVRTLIADAQQKGLKNPNITDLLINGQNPAKVRYPPAVVDAAFALDGWGFLTQSQIHGLNLLGLIVGNRYRRGNAPKQPTIGQSIGGAVSGAANSIAGALGG